MPGRIDRKKDLAERPLTPQQSAFVEAYLREPQAAYKAAIVAGISEKSAPVMAHKWLKKVNILAEINRRREKVAEAADISKEKILRELAITAFFDPGDLFDENGDLLKVSDMNPETRKAIGGIDNKPLYDADGNEVGMLVKVKLNSKLQALDQISALMGYKVERKEIDIRIGIGERLNAALKRVGEDPIDVEEKNGPF